MLCACHGEPMLWNRDTRYRLNGFWRCAVKNRERSATNYAKSAGRYLQQRRDRYDNDPVHRIEKRIRDNAHGRAQTLSRRRESLGALQD